MLCMYVSFPEILGNRGLLCYCLQITLKERLSACYKPAWEHGAGRPRPKPKPRSRTAQAQPADQVVEADLDRPVRAYAFTDRYESGDRIEHPTLGLGVVQGLAGTMKIHVLFDDKKSVLVHARPSEQV